MFTVLWDKGQDKCLDTEIWANKEETEGGCQEIQISCPDFKLKDS